MTDGLPRADFDAAFARVVAIRDPAERARAAGAAIEALQREIAELSIARRAVFTKLLGGGTTATAIAADLGITRSRVS